MMDIEQIINEVNGSMKIEGIELTEENKENIRICLADSSKYEEIKQGILAKYTKHSEE